MNRSFSRFCLFIAAALALPALGAFAEQATDEKSMKPYVQPIPGSDVSFKLAPIPGGQFLLGSPEDEADRGDDEGPQIQVKVEPFWMGVHEVTWDELDLFVGEYDRITTEGLQNIPDDKVADAVSFPTPIYEKGLDILGRWGRSGGFPAADMSQFLARQYTKWLTKKTGHFYRLPTEAEWEYAARAGTTTAWSWGDSEDGVEDHAWYYLNALDENLDENRFWKIGQKQPNPWGLHDIHGNVAEWVIDAYDPDWYGNFAGMGVVPAEKLINWPTKKYPHTIRGGSWDHDPDKLRSAARNYSDEDLARQDPQEPKSVWWPTDGFWIGFRIVRPLVEPSDEMKQKFWGPDAEEIKDVLGFDTKQVKALITTGE